MRARSPRYEDYFRGPSTLDDWGDIVWEAWWEPDEDRQYEAPGDIYGGYFLIRKRGIAWAEAIVGVRKSPAARLHYIRSLYQAKGGYALNAGNVPQSALDQMADDLGIYRVGPAKRALHDAPLKRDTHGRYVR